MTFSLIYCLILRWPFVVWATGNLFRLWHSLTNKQRLQWHSDTEMSRDMTNQQYGCAPNEDSDQPGHPSSLIRIFAVRMKKAWVLSYPLSAQQRLWSAWADAQANLSLHWAHTHFVSFVMSRLKCTINKHYRKNPKISDTQKIAVIIVKLEQNRFTTYELAQKM